MTVKRKNSAPKQQSQNLVINNITIQPVPRNTADIDTWRSALKAADRGKRKALYNLYEDLMLDPILSDAIDKRIEAITNAELVFKSQNGEAVAEIDDLMDTPEFEDMLIEIMQAKFWGISLLEFDFSDGFSFNSIPRKHIRPATKQIALNESDDGGPSYLDNDSFIEVGKNNDLGLILKAAPYVIYKRGGFGDWAEYAEIFGMPFQVAKYNNYDEATRQELIRALEQSGSLRRTVIPKESDIEYKDNKSSGDGAIYDRLRMACIQEILIGILGQTMTTLDGSSRAQGEVHMEVLESKHKADRRFVQRVLNRKLLPILENRGYPVSGGYFAFPDAGETVTMLERMSLVKDAVGMVPIPADYIYETFGIPKPDENEEVVHLRQSAPVIPEEEIPDDPDEDADAANHAFFARLFRFFAGAPYTGASDGNHLTNPADDPADDFYTRLIKRVARGEAAYFDAELFGRIAGELVAALGRGFAGRPRNDGFDYGHRNAVAQTAMETNLYHFSAAKTLAELQKLNQLFRDSKSSAEFMEKARQVTEVFNKAWAQTEYNTAGLIAESTATYNRLMGQVELFPYWEYRTAGDDHVREEHRKLDGVILPANDVRWKKIYPPNGWNCRCYVVPRMQHEVAGIDIAAMRRRVDEYFETAEYKNAKAQGFGVNRAVLPQVFDENQFYIRKFPGKAAKYLDRLGASDFGLSAVSKGKAAATQYVPRFTGTAGEWFDSRQRQGKVTLMDRNDRQVVIEKVNFDRHTTGSHRSRVEYLDCLSQILKNPDEVWINNERAGKPYDNYTLIKYYRDEVVVVCCRISDGELNTVRTWFPLRMKKEVITKHRRGLLVYTKKASG